MNNHRKHRKKRSLHKNERERADVSYATSNARREKKLHVLVTHCKKCLVIADDAKFSIDFWEISKHVFASFCFKVKEHRLSIILECSWCLYNYFFLTINFQNERPIKKKVYWVLFSKSMGKKKPHFPVKKKNK